jgi:hypothetical protein
MVRVRDEPALCRGDGSRGFVLDVPVEPSPHAGMHTTGAQIAYAGAAADFDGDGWVDVYVTQYEDYDIGKFFADVVYGNAQGEGLVVAGQVPRALAGRGVEVADYDGDGDPDVYVANYRLRENFLIDNDGQGGLREIQEEVGAAGEWAHTISSAFGDLDGDGDLDLVIGNFSHPGQPGPAVLRNEIATQGRFVDVADHGIEWQESYASFALADYDNDGDLDLFITTVYPGDHGRLYRNRGDATFEDLSAQEGLGEQAEGYGLALGDIDGDGTIDALLGGTQPAHVYLGEPSEGHWLQLRLRGDGVSVNAAAIGARVIVRAGDRMVVREVQAGGNGGDRGGSPLRLHFGLGAHEGAVEIEVRWPWAETCLYEVEVDQLATIEYEPRCDGGSETGGSTGGAASSGDDTSTGGIDLDTTTTADPTTETADATTGPGQDPAPADEGCGCRHGGGGAAVAFVLVPLAWRRRGRR